MMGTPAGLKLLQYSLPGKAKTLLFPLERRSFWAQLPAITGTCFHCLSLLSLNGFALPASRHGPIIRAPIDENATAVLLPRSTGYARTNREVLPSSRPKQLPCLTLGVESVGSLLAANN